MLRPVSNATSCKFTQNFLQFCRLFSFLLQVSWKAWFFIYYFVLRKHCSNFALCYFSGCFYVDCTTVIFCTFLFDSLQTFANYRNLRVLSYGLLFIRVFFFEVMPPKRKSRTGATPVRGEGRTTRSSAKKVSFFRRGICPILDRITANYCLSITLCKFM